MTRLGDSVARTLPLLAGDLSSNTVVEQLLSETHTRRRMDLSDLNAKEQAELIASRTVDLLPTVDALREAIEGGQRKGRPLTVKLGIDPTSADIHFGHAVPIVILSRFQRMGHQVVFIIGDITAKIGDPSGRSDERPPLTDQQIADNLATYRDQVSPFFDFAKADFRHNSEWLEQVRLPELIGILSQIPVSMSLQREDFRSRLASGHGLAMSEFIYAVVMAIDSVKIEADIELGGVDQLLNMQMGRKVMEVVGQDPQMVATMPLIEGTDGSGAKMSKSRDNYVALSGTPEDTFGKLMSIPDRLMEPYLKAWTEWTDEEIHVATARLADGSLHPMDLKKVLAGEAVAAVHNVDDAMAARENFTAQFARRTFADVEALPLLDLADLGDQTLGEALTKTLDFTPSLSAARRIARQNGLRIVVEDDSGQNTVRLDETAVSQPLLDVINQARQQAGDAGTAYVKVGRKLARVDETPQ